MTLSANARLENHRTALTLLLQELGDRAIDVALFQSDAPAFKHILRTTWESLERDGYLSSVAAIGYRLTPKGWLLALEASSVLGSSAFENRLGVVLAAMKRHVKGRHESQVVPLSQLAAESGEPEGFLFNIVDSKSSSTGNARTGAEWFPDARGRLVVIPVDFNLEPVDIATAFSVQHLEKIEELEARLAEVEEDRAQFHCPYCDARLSDIAHQDYPEHHCLVTYERFECGYVAGDGFETHPCPYGPNWPTLDEFEFEATPYDKYWNCSPKPKTKRAQKVSIRSVVGRSKEEAEQYARNAVAKIKKGERRGPTDMFNNNLFG